MNLVNLQPNDIAPAVTLLSLDGQSIPLARMWQDGQNTLLVFLRHLG